MAIGAHPKNIAKTTKILWDLADEIWYIAGDRSMNVIINCQTTRLRNILV